MPVPDDKDTKTPPAGDPPPDDNKDTKTPPAGDPPPDDAKGGKGQTPEQLAAELADARKEAAKYRTENKKLADAAEAAAKAKMTDDEKKAADLAAKEKTLAEREAAATERSVVAEIKSIAAAAGVAPAKLALMPRLIDRGDIEFDDSGEPKNIGKLVETLLKEHPDFKGTATAGSGSADGGHRGGKGTLTLDAIKKMSSSEINKRWDEVQDFLAHQRSS